MRFRLLGPGEFAMMRGHYPPPPDRTPPFMMHLPDSAVRAAARLLTAMAAACSLLIAALGSGCVYRINIQQGNFLDPKALEQLSVGMTRSQVRYLMGTPMVPNSFDNDRWDYLFYFKHGRTRKAEESQISVYFEDEKVTRIERPRGPAKVAVTKPTETSEKPTESTDAKATAGALPPPPPSPAAPPEASPPPPPPSPP